MKYHFEIHKETDGFWAQGLELPGCITQGSSRTELLHNITEALNLYIEEPEESTYLADLPDDSYMLSDTIVEVSVDPAIAFGFLVRYSRMKSGLTQKEAAHS